MHTYIIYIYVKNIYTLLNLSLYIHTQVDIVSVSVHEHGKLQYFTTYFTTAY